METNRVSRGDLVRADDGLNWRVERADADSMVLYSMDGSRQRFVDASRIKVNFTFNQRLHDGDLSALVQLTPEERSSFEDRSWQMFFARHVKYSDCDALRSLIEAEFHGEPISLRGLEEVASRIDSSLPKRQL